VTLEALLTTAILIMIFLIFLLIFAHIAISFVKWSRAPVYYAQLIRLDDYSCPKCSSKELELIGRRTIRCKKCGTVFTIQPETAIEEHWIIWPFWFFPLIWPIPSKD
jgi:hypothetical protein